MKIRPARECRFDLLALGDTTRVFNRGNRTKVIGSVGIGVTY